MLKRGIKISAGIICIIIGFIALITPLTPGSWLIFVGAELLGLRMLLKARRKMEKTAEDVKETVQETTTQAVRGAKDAVENTIK